MQKLSRPYLVSLQPVHQRDTHNTTGNTCADRQINVHLATVSNHRPILFTPPTSLHSLCFAHFTHILNYPLHPLTQPPIHSTYSLNHSTHSPIHSTHSLNHSIHSLNHSTHSLNPLTQPLHALTHPPHPFTHPLHPLTHTPHSLTHLLTHPPHSLTHTFAHTYSPIALHMDPMMVASISMLVTPFSFSSCR